MAMDINFNLDDPDFKKLQLEIKRFNAEFSKMGKVKQRTTIARDVIAHLKVGKLKARSTYLMLPGGKEEEIAKFAGLQPVKAERIDASCVLAQMPCDVCGIGSLFVAALFRNDKMPLKDFIEGQSSGEVRDMEVTYLKEWFDGRDLDKVEYYFENHNENSRHPILKNYDRTERLVMIMENIISNRGRFIPSKGKHSRASAR